MSFYYHITTKERIMKVMYGEKVEIGTIGLIGLMLGIFSCVPCILPAQEILNIDFSAAQGYINDFVVGQPAGATNQWLDLVDTGITGIIPADDYFIENEKLIVWQNGSGAAWIYMMFPPQTKGDLTLTWDWQYVGLPEESIDVGVNLSDSANYSLSITAGSLSGWGRQTTSIRMAQANGVIDLHNGSDYSALVPYSYTDGKLISIRYIVHLDKKTFDAYAQKEGEEEVALGIGYGYRRDVSATTGGLDHLSIWLSGSTTSECHIDNIVLIATGGNTSISDWFLYE